MYRYRRALFGVLSLGLVAAFAAPGPTLAQTAEPPQTDASPSPMPGDDPAPAPDPSVDDPPIAADAAEPTDVGDPQPSGAAARLADWVAASGDNKGRPFMIVDKLAADAFVFDADGLSVGSAPVLVGIARGDDSAPGVGDLALSAIPLDERTTPAGRFVAHFGPSVGEGGTVLWVDYADAISMHPVIVGTREHRLRRIGSADPEQHRISHGCINVPANFYKDVLLSAFGAGGVVYILPDTKPLAEVFPAFAAATDADAEGLAGAPQTRCADPTLEARDSLPAPDPSRMCPADDRRTTEAAATP